MPGTGGGAREGRDGGGCGGAGALRGIAGPIFSFSSSGLK